MGHKKRRSHQLVSQPAAPTPEPQQPIAPVHQAVSRRFKLLCIAGAGLFLFALAIYCFFTFSAPGDFYGATILDMTDHKITIHTDYYATDKTLTFNHDITEYFSIGDRYDFRTTKAWNGRSLITVNHTLPYDQPPE